MDRKETKPSEESRFHIEKLEERIAPSATVCNFGLGCSGRGQASVTPDSSGQYYHANGNSAVN